MQIIKTTGLVLVIGGLLVGCESYDKHYQYLLGPEVNGESTRYNANVHIVDPNPEAAENTEIPVDGSRATDAIERYRSGQDYEPEEVEIDVNN
jgi:hypothetical protein